MTQADKDRLQRVHELRIKQAQESLRPLRVAMLRLMPRAGSRLGYHVLAATSRAMKDELNKDVPVGGRVTSAQLNAQLRMMKLEGWIIDVYVTPHSQGMGWQITPEGEKWLDGTTTQTEEEQV